MKLNHEICSSIRCITYLVQCANQAPTWQPDCFLFLVIFIHFYLFEILNNTLQQSSKGALHFLLRNFKSQTHYETSIGFKVVIKAGGKSRITLAKYGFQKTLSVSKWARHGQICLLIVSHDSPLDITIYMDKSPMQPWARQFDYNFKRFATEGKFV